MKVEGKGNMKEGGRHAYAERIQALSSEILGAHTYIHAHLCVSRPAFVLQRVHRRPQSRLDLLRLPSLKHVKCQPSLLPSLLLSPGRLLFIGQEKFGGEALKDLATCRKGVGGREAGREGERAGRRENGEGSRVRINEEEEKRVT